MKLQYAVGIDIGTQGTKAALFSLDGKKMSEAFEKSNLIYGGPGEVCQNAEDIYGSVLRTVNALMKKERCLAKTGGCHGNRRADGGHHGSGC